VPERDADFRQVLIGQIAENAGIDVIFGKTLRVLPEAKCVEPVRNLLLSGTDCLGVAKATETISRSLGPGHRGINCRR
jgi:hypothetical protein